MKRDVSESCSIAAVVAPEDLCRGDFVAVLSEVIQLPTFLWCDVLPSCRESLVRLQYVPTDDRAPLKVKAICLPFVFVKSPRGEFQTLNVRLTSLARLDKRYAKRAWKDLKKAAGQPRRLC